MTRIICRTPATDKPILIAQNLQEDIEDDAEGEWVTIISPSDFSVPDTQRIYPVRDPLDDSRGIRSGELFFLTPLRVINRRQVPFRFVELGFQRPNGARTVIERIEIPFLDSYLFQIQGMSLLKEAHEANGTSLQLRAQRNSNFHVTAMVQQRPASDHIGVQA